MVPKGQRQSVTEFLPTVVKCRHRGIDVQATAAVWINEVARLMMTSGLWPGELSDKGDRWTGVPFCCREHVDAKYGPISRTSAD